MPRFGLAIVHSGTPQQNAAQVTRLANMIHRVTLPDGDERFEFIGLATDHDLRCAQIVPANRTLPTNAHLIESIYVYYSSGDIASPLFVNWAAQRTTSLGADTVLFVSNASQFSVTNLANEMALLTGTTVLREPSWGLLASIRLFMEVGWLNESLSLSASVADLKTRITAAGLTYG